MPVSSKAVGVVKGSSASKHPGEPPAFPRIERPSVAHEVARLIQAHLAARKLRAGDKLPAERALSELLGVSRTSVRDALKRLEALGIIEARRGKGTFVQLTQYPPLQGTIELGPHVPRKDLQRVLEARVAVEVAIAGLAATRASARSLREIAEYVASVAKEPTAATRRFSPDLRFEALIGRAANNPYLLRMQEYAHTAYAKVWDRIGFIPRPAHERLEQHRAILAALERRDAEAARRAMAEHLDITDKIKPLRIRRSTGSRAGNTA
jgi:GntR family transcriptional repressor for pyruvate dehydrogenase complex